jgi:hypothetical protein
MLARLGSGLLRLDKLAPCLDKLLGTGLELPLQSRGGGARANCTRFQVRSG